jgi:hypothetical protein
MPLDKLATAAASALTNHASAGGIIAQLINVPKDLYIAAKTRELQREEGRKSREHQLTLARQDFENKRHQMILERALEESLAQTWDRRRTRDFHNRVAQWAYGQTEVRALPGRHGGAGPVDSHAP